MTDQFSCRPSDACHSSGGCGFSVSVEYGFKPCYFEDQYFDIEIRCSDGSPAAAGKVEGGSSAYFTLPCEGVYSVTVSGPHQFSPRSQTKRVQCRRGCTNGATFIFNSIAPVHPYPPKPDCPCKPERPCRPDRPDHSCEPCRPEHPCEPPVPDDCPCGSDRPVRPCRELNIRCSRNGITIL